MQLSKTSPRSQQLPLFRPRVVILSLIQRAHSFYRVGENHHNARISDAVVDRIRDRHEDDGIGYKDLAVEFGISINTIRKICSYERRAHTPELYRRVTIPAGQ